MPAGQGNNKYYPAISSGMVTVPSSGSIEVDTELRDLDQATVSLAQNSAGTAASCSWTRVTRAPGDLTAKITIKTWAADGATAGSSACNVSWMAFGKF
jgi:hypothetical protein